MKKKQTSEKRVGKTANLIIFLGILYSSISILAITVCSFFIERGYGIKSLIIGLIVIGLGYGIRYGKMSCLYFTTGLFTAVSIYYLYTIIAGRHIIIIRFLFCVWAISSLAMAIPAMVKLKAAGNSPDRNSRYKDFFLRRKRGL